MDLKEYIAMFQIIQEGIIFRDISPLRVNGAYQYANSTNCQTMHANWCMIWLRLVLKRVDLSAMSRKGARIRIDLRCRKRKITVKQ